MSFTFWPAYLSSLTLSLAILLLAHPTLTTRASLLSPNMIKLVPTSGPLHMFFIMPVACHSFSMSFRSLLNCHIMSKASFSPVPIPKQVPIPHFCFIFLHSTHHHLPLHTFTFLFVNYPLPRIELCEGRFFCHSAHCCIPSEALIFFLNEGSGSGL